MRKGIAVRPNTRTGMIIWSALLEKKVAATKCLFVANRKYMLGINMHPRIINLKKRKRKRERRNNMQVERIVQLQVEFRLMLYKVHKRSKKKNYCHPLNESSNLCTT